MTAEAIAQVYLRACLLLAAGYAALALMRAALRALGVNVSHRQWIAIAQCLVLVSVIAPVTLHLLPARRLPSIELRDFWPLPEGGAAIEGGRTARVPRNGTSHSSAHAPSLAPAALRRELEAFGASFAIGAAGLGFLFAAARLGRSMRGLRATIRSASLMHSLGSVRVLVSGEISIPFSAWMGRAHWVVLPTGLLLSRGDFRLALKHELQHHRSGDTRWAALMELLACCFFLNPAIHLWRRKISELQEFSCDEALIGRRGVSPREYGSCLVRVAEAALKDRRMYAGTTCMAAVLGNPIRSRSLLRRRVEMFERYKVPHAGKWVSALLVAGSMAGTLAFALDSEQAARRSQLGANAGISDSHPAIQAIADRVLAEAVKAQGAKGGFAIVAEPASGRVLAVAEVDPTGKRPAGWALTQAHEPASLLKGLVAAQAIEAGLTTPEARHPCESGSYRFGNRVYHDWKAGGWRQLTTAETVAVSSDICAMKIAEKLGPEGLRRMLVDFGFGPGGSAKSFPGARPGTLPASGTVHGHELVPAVSAGFGFQATPLELVQAYGAIANGGVLLEPRSALDETGPRTVRRVLSPENAGKAKGILRQVVLKGTAKGISANELYPSAGKTATSYIPDLTQWDLVEGTRKGNFAGFIGFAPVNEPRIEVYVGILDPRSEDHSGAHGAQHAAPVFRRIVDEVLRHLNVPKDRG